MEGGHLRAGRSGKQAEEAAPVEWVNVVCLNLPACRCPLSWYAPALAGCDRNCFYSLIDGVKVTATSRPSGERNRLALWPQSSLLFPTSIRCPRDSRSAKALSTFSTSNASHAWEMGTSSATRPHEG
jgi:hypothetical protein